MAVDITKFRDKLQVKLWSNSSPINRTVTVYNTASSIVDDYGDVYYTDDAGTSVKAIPYNTFGFQRDHLKWGELQAGQTEEVFRYDTDLQSGSIIVDANGTTTSYEVQDIETFPYGAGDVAKVVRLRELL